MAIDFGRVARGVATGYLTAKVADTAAQDELNREFILQASDQYFNVDKPQFVADERKRSANIDFISTKLSPVYANYADANNITLSDVNTRDFISSINDLSNEDKFKIESTITQRKKTRTQTFDEKNKFITDQFKNLKGGPGSMNITSMFFPNEGQDIAEVGVKQGIAAPTDDMQSMMQIQGTGNNFDIMIGRHATIASQADTDFRNFFRNDVGQASISFAESAAQYPLQQELLKGYDEAEAAGFNKGKYEYARLNYIDQELKREGITGFPTGFPTVEEAKTTEAGTTGAAATTTETKAVPEDGKKFDAPDTSQIGVKEDAKINILSKRPLEGGGFGSAATVINDLRDIIARISDSPSLSDDEKSKRIDIARSRAKERLEAMGLDPDNFNL